MQVHSSYYFPIEVWIYPFFNLRKMGLSSMVTDSLSPQLKRRIVSQPYKECVNEDRDLIPASYHILLSRYISNDGFSTKIYPYLIQTETDFFAERKWRRIFSIILLQCLYCNGKLKFIVIPMKIPHNSKKQKKFSFSWTNTFLKSLVLEVFYISQNKRTGI